MKLAFLGTGSAFSLERYNSGLVVDGHLLLDAGAPLLPHMRRLGIDPGGIDVLFLTHHHGDHLLGLPPFLLHRAFVDPRPLTVVGPPATEEVVDRLCSIAWGADWPGMRSELSLDFQIAAARSTAAGIPYQSSRLRHGTSGGTGYRLHVDGRTLAYSGDSEATAELERLVEGANVAVVEATGPGHPKDHTSWEEAVALEARHPSTRFIFTHLYSGELEGAAADFQVLDV